MSKEAITTRVKQQLHRASMNAASAKRALGLALLKGIQDVRELRTALAEAETAVTDAEAMFAALPEYTTQGERDHVPKARPKPVSLAEYTDARKAFMKAIDSRSMARDQVIARGTELVELAKRSGQRALSDVRARFNGLRKYPELHRL